VAEGLSGGIWLSLYSSPRLFSRRATWGAEAPLAISLLLGLDVSPKEP